ncbi:MAG: hypothetical protein LBI49_04645 [Nocardiopsaceae bacterium]|nr:hypothetical protein [Nocardiopsaceae bacterium]
MGFEQHARDLAALLGAPGPVPAARRAAVLHGLIGVWDSLTGADQASMTAHKLARAEQMRWEPPVLRFALERHPGGIGDAPSVPVEHWAVDLAAGTAVLTGTGYRQSVAAAHHWDARPVVAELAAKLREGAADPRLHWPAGRDTCTPVLAEILPPEAIGPVRQAMDHRFRAAWRSMMRTLGWTPHPSHVMSDCFLRPARELEDERTNALIQEWITEYKEKEQAAGQEPAGRPQDYEALVRVLGVRFPGARAFQYPQDSGRFMIGPPGQGFGNARELRLQDKRLGYAEGLCRWNPDAEPALHGWGVDPGTGEAVEITLGLAQLAASDQDQAEYTGVQINLPRARMALRRHQIRLGSGSVLQAMISTAVVTADTITWPYHPGVIAGITRADWEAAEAAMRTAVLAWAAARGVTSLTQIKPRRPARD